MTNVVHKSLVTPMGPMVALASPQGLCALEFTSAGRQEILAARLRRWFPKSELCRGDDDDPFIASAEDWLAHYFSDRLADARPVQLDLRGTAFEVAVWHAMQLVAYGATSTYGDLAKRVGNPSASRAVGGAAGRNPVSIIVPCHRIIGTSGNLTGYGGGLHNKEWLLTHEQSAVGTHRARSFFDAEGKPQGVTNYAGRAE